MAQSFFSSPEYQSLNRAADGFVTDLYRTFFDRDPDAAGRDYWIDRLSAGIPRDGVLISFMFSPEFTAFVEANLPIHRALIASLSPEQFRRHVRQGAGDHALAGQRTLRMRQRVDLVGVEHPRQPEVEHLGAARRDHHVRALQIAMGHAPFVGMRECIGDLGAVPLRRRDRQRSLAEDLRQ
jgi:hypothetical protein